MYDLLVVVILLVFMSAHMVVFTLSHVLPVVCSCTLCLWHVIHVLPLPFAGRTTLLIVPAVGVCGFVMQWTSMHLDLCPTDRHDVTPVPKYEWGTALLSMGCASSEA